MDERIFLMKRPLQWSHLVSGLPIPKEFQPLTYNFLGKRLKVQEGINVRVKLGGKIYNTRLYNIGFNRNKFTHSEILQFKYDSNTELLDKMQEIFSKEYQYCLTERNLKQKEDNTRVNISKAFETSIIVYGTEEPDLFIWEPQFEDIAKASRDDIKKMSEEEFESIIARKDPKAGIKHVSRLQTVRELDRSIGDSLKKLYDYRCQMTGEKIGDEYACTVVEAHHINPFTVSLNNNPSNIIILSPNYHRIVHKTKATFDRKNLSFVYPNGLEEKVKLNKHLGKR